MTTGRNQNNKSFELSTTFFLNLRNVNSSGSSILTLSFKHKKKIQYALFEIDRTF